MLNLVATPSELHWETGTDGETTPRAGTPQALEADDPPMNATSTEVAADLMLELTLQREDEIDPARDRPNNADLPGGVQSRSHRPDQESNTQLKILRSRFESLLSDIDAGVTIDRSRVESSEFFLSTFRPSRSSEDNLVSVFESVLAAVRAEWASVERQRREDLRTSGDLQVISGSIPHRPNSRLLIWKCCECRDGESFLERIVDCSICAHFRCAAHDGNAVRFWDD